MSFVYEEKLSKTDAAKANALARSVGENDDIYNQWTINRERDVVMLCFSLTSRMMTGPGKYGLFIKNRGLCFKVQYKSTNEEGVNGFVITFDKLSLEIPKDFGVSRDEVVQLIREALETFGKSMPYTALARINIE